MPAQARGVIAKRPRSGAPTPRTRRGEVPLRSFTILAQDPAVLLPGGRALTTQVWLPAERLRPGPKGHRVHVIDFDAATRDQKDPKHIRADFDSGDHLHPQDTGYKAMADAVDLSLLGLKQ